LLTLSSCITLLLCLKCKILDEIKYPGFAYSLLIMAFTYQLATRLEPCGSGKQFVNRFSIPDYHRFLSSADLPVSCVPLIGKRHDTEHVFFSSIPAIG
jgi:hypothetical protein